MAVTRELVITYGSYTIGQGNGSIGPDGPILLTKSFDEGSVEFRFAVVGNTAAVFATNCRTAETAFRKPFQDLTITQDGESLISALQSGGTALDPQPEIVKQEDEGNTGRSRIYTVRIDFGLPATTGAEPTTGLRESSIDVSYDPARRRTIRISGIFTATASNSARSQYEAQIASYASSILSTLGVTQSELAEEPLTSHDTNNRTIEFTRVYDELIFSQGGASLNDSDLVRQRLSINKRQEAPGDTPVAERLATLDLSYEVWIDKDQTTDLRSKYSSIRSWLITQITSTLNGGSMALIAEDPRYYYDENRISVSMTAVGQPSGEIVIENRVTVDDDDQTGAEIVPAWTGDPLSAYVYDGPRIVVRTVTQTQRRIGIFNEQDAMRFLRQAFTDATGRDPWEASGGTWTEIRRRPSATHLEMGIGSDTLDVTELGLTSQARYTKEPTPSSGGGGGGGAITPR